MYLVLFVVFIAGDNLKLSLKGLNFLLLLKWNQHLFERKLWVDHFDSFFSNWPFSNFELETWTCKEKYVQEVKATAERKSEETLEETLSPNKSLLQNISKFSVCYTFWLFLYSIIFLILVQFERSQWDLKMFETLPVI